MKIDVKDRDIGITDVFISKLNEDTLLVNICTKIKYPEIMHGSSYEGCVCAGIMVTMFDSLKDDNSDDWGEVVFTPENNWEQEFIQNCDYYQGSTRYGPEIVYIRVKPNINSYIGQWNK